MGAKAQAPGGSSEGQGDIWTMATAETNPESLNEMIFISSSTLINLFETTHRNCIAILTFLDKAACCKHLRSATKSELVVCRWADGCTDEDDDDVERYCTVPTRLLRTVLLVTNLHTTDILERPPT